MFKFNFDVEEDPETDILLESQPALATTQKMQAAPELTSHALDTPFVEHHLVDLVSNFGQDRTYKLIIMMYGVKA